MKTTNTLLVLVASVLSTGQAFVVAPATTNAVTTLSASTIYSDFENSHATTSEESQGMEDLTKFTTPVTNGRSTSLQTMDLPRHSQEAAMKNAKILEAVAGRGAMLAALALMGTELTTGMSLPEQLARLLN